MFYNGVANNYDRIIVRRYEVCSMVPGTFGRYLLCLVQTIIIYAENRKHKTPKTSLSFASSIYLALNKLLSLVCCFNAQEETERNMYIPVYNTYYSHEKNNSFYSLAVGIIRKNQKSVHLCTHEISFQSVRSSDALLRMDVCTILLVLITMKLDEEFLKFSNLLCSSFLWLKIEKGQLENNNDNDLALIN